MLDAAIKSQLKAYLEKLQSPIELVASLDAGDKSKDVSRLLDDIATLSNKVSVRENGDSHYRPSFSVGPQGKAARIHFAGIPMGHEFTSLVLALLHSGGHPPKVDAKSIVQIKAIDGNFHSEGVVTISCHDSPDVVQAVNLMAALNPNISATMSDGVLFHSEVEQRQIMAVPTVYLNGEHF